MQIKTKDNSKVVNVNDINYHLSIVKLFSNDNIHPAWCQWIKTLGPPPYGALPPHNGLWRLED